MATLNKTTRNGKRCYQIWTGAGNDRRQIWLGPVMLRQAREFLKYVDLLEDANQTGTRPGELVSGWLQELPQRQYDRLYRAGLVKPRCSRTVREFLTERRRKLNCSPRTDDIYRRAHDKFMEFLGDSDVLLSEVTPEQAHDFYHHHLPSLGMAESYRARQRR